MQRHLSGVLDTEDGTKYTGKEKNGETATLIWAESERAQSAPQQHLQTESLGEMTCGGIRRVALQCRRQSRAGGRRLVRLGHQTGRCRRRPSHHYGRLGRRRWQSRSHPPGPRAAHPLPLHDQQLRRSRRSRLVKGIGVVVTCAYRTLTSTAHHMQSRVHKLSIATVGITAVSAYPGQIP